MMNVVEAKVDMKKDIEKAKELKESFFQLSDFDKIEKLEEYRDLLADEYVCFKGYDYFKYFNFQECTTGIFKNQILYIIKKEFLKIIKKVSSKEFDLDSNSKEQFVRVTNLLKEYNEEEIEDTVNILEKVTFYNDLTNKLIEDYLEIFMDYCLIFEFMNLNHPIAEMVPFMSIHAIYKSLLKDEYLRFGYGQEISYVGHTLTSSNFIFYSIAYLMRTKK